MDNKRSLPQDDGTTSDTVGSSSNNGMETFVNMPNRKAILLGLVPSLSLDEIWSLQTRLSSLDLRTDIFGRLPLELQIIVADQLGPADLGACLAVSRRWQSVFLHDSVRNGLTRRCFPSLPGYIQVVGDKLEANNHRGQGHDRNDDNTAVTLTERVFVQTTSNYALRERGRFRFVYRHILEPAVSSVNPGYPMSWLRDPTNPMPVPVEVDEGNSLQPGHLRRRGGYGKNAKPGHCHMARDYAYGRIVWETVYEERASFIVDDMRTGQRFHFDVANNVVRGDMYVYTALGDRLLIAVSGARLIAWDIATGENQTKMVPSEVDVVATLGRRVCIMARGKIYFWELGGSIQEVDMSVLETRHQQPDNDGRLPSFLILDPVQEDVFFLGKYEVETDAQRRRGHFCFYVHEFRGLVFKQTYTYRLAFEDSEFPMHLIEVMNRRNSTGLYTLASWRVCNAGGYNARSEWGSVKVIGIGSVAFDIYTKAFSQSYFRLPNSMPQWTNDGLPLSYVHIWNDQMLTIMDRYKDAASGKVYKGVPLLFAFEDENSEAAARQGPQPFSRVPLYSSQLLDLNGKDVQKEGFGNMADQSDTAMLIDETDRAASASAITRPDRQGQQSPSQQTKQPLIDPTPERRVRVPFDDVVPYPPGSWVLDDEDWAKDNCRVRYALDLGQLGNGADRKPAHVGMHYFQGDDEFLAFYHNHEYTVWSFHDDPVGSIRQHMAGRMGKQYGSAASAIS